MRTFQSLDEAFQEIQRDVYKGVPIKSSRVQQRLEGHMVRERMGYEYTIAEGGFPADVTELMKWAAPRLPFWEAHYNDILSWLVAEETARIYPDNRLFMKDATEALHPALKSTFEGNWPAYTYHERLLGMEPSMLSALMKAPDTRRAFWPIYRPEDGVRSSSPTRIPCSLGYQFVIRNLGGVDRLLMFYLSRSVDFDTFWLSDLWLAHTLQERLAYQLDVEMGYLSHYIVSFHSFSVDSQEIY